MQGITTNRRKQAKRVAIVWFVTFVALEVAFGLAVQGPLSYIRNPDYEKRSAHLRALRQIDSDRPFVLLLGSSRAQHAVRPDLINDNPNQPFVYSFARAGQGPRHHCVTLKRLLRDGQRPDSVILELVPHQLLEPVAKIDSTNLLSHNHTELTESLPFREKPDQTYEEWLRAQIIMPCFTHRYHLVNQIVPAWNSREQDVACGSTKDPYGWVSSKRNKNRDPNGPKIAQDASAQWISHLQIEPMNRMAIEEIIGVCRRERIALAVLFMPEGPAFRSCYTKKAEEDLHEIQIWFTSFPGVTVVNAREWLNDEDFFIDSHHVDCDHAPLFTKMLAERVLPMLPSVSSDWAHR